MARASREGTPPLFDLEPEANPLALYLQSLGRYETMAPDTLVLPSHGKPFRGVRTRITQLREHHDARLAEVRVACAEQPMSAADIVPIMFRRRELDNFREREIREDGSDETELHEPLLLPIGDSPVESRVDGRMSTVSGAPSRVLRDVTFSRTFDPKMTARDKRRQPTVKPSLPAEL